MAALFSAINDKIDPRHDHRSADHIAERHRQKIADEKLPGRHLRPEHHAERNVRHIGYAVLKAGKDKEHDWKPDPKDLADDIFRSCLQPEGQDNEHIAEDPS